MYNNTQLPTNFPANLTIGVTDNHSTVNHSVVLNLDDCKMYLVETKYEWNRGIGENHNGFSITPSAVNAQNFTHTKTHCKAICNGTFQVVDKTIVKNPDGSQNDYKSFVRANFNVWGRESTSSCLRMCELHDEKAVCYFLQNNCMLFEKKYASALVNHFRLSVQQIPGQEETLGINKLLKSSNHIPSTDEIIKSYHLKGEYEDVTICDSLIPLSLRCVSAMMSFWKHTINEIPLVVFFNSDFEAMTEEICKSFRTKVNSYEKDISKEFLRETDKAIVISTENLSDYKKKGAIQKLCTFQTHGEHDNILVIPILLEKNISNVEFTHKILMIPYIIQYIDDAPDVSRWLLNIICRDESIKDKLLQYRDFFFEEIIKENVVGKVLNSLISAMLATATIIVENLNYNSKKQISILCCMKNWLIDYANRESWKYTDIFVNYIRRPDLPVIDIKCAHNREKIPTIITDECKIYLDKMTLVDIADNIGSTFIGLRNELDNDDFFLRKSGKSLQINKALNGTSEYFYTIEQSKIFPPGEVRLHADNFAEKRPDIMIPIGRCGDEVINFAINSVSEMINNHLSVLGNSGSGKTYFIAEFIKKAAENGIDTYIVGKTDAEISYLNDNLYRKIVIHQGEEIEISYEENGEGKIFAFYVDGDVDDGCDIVLSNLWEKLRKRKCVKPVFVVVDEAHELNLAQDSVFVKKFLKQGRKFGIIVVMSTQATNSDIAKNLTSVMNQFMTSFEFRTSDSTKSMRNLRIDSAEEGYSAVKKDLLNLDVGTCYAKGNLATDKDYVRYPVKLQIESNDSERSI